MRLLGRPDPLARAAVAARRTGLSRLVVPGGATHVLEHVPACQFQPDHTSGRGAWVLWPLGNFLAADPVDGMAELYGDACVSESGLAAFARQETGCPVTLTRFKVKTTDRHGTHREPAFYVTPGN